LHSYFLIFGFVNLTDKSKHNSAADDDKACHKIFEALFRFVSIEKPLFSRSGKSVAQGSSASRLSECASVLRVAVEVLLTNFRTKSLHALVDHIIQTLLDTNVEVRKLLGVDYVKCLKSILEYPPHTEHLGEEEWKEVANFCVHCLGHRRTVETELSFRTSRHSSSERLDSGVDKGTPSGSISNRSVRNVRNGISEFAIEEIIICIQLLTSSANAPIHDSAEKLLYGLAQFLSSFSSTEYAQQAAIKAINSIISQVMFDQAALVKEFFLDIISVLRRLWSGKLSGLKDEILITLMLCIDLLRDQNQISLRSLNVELIEGFADAMLSEYIKRPERELLQIDDVIFCKTSASATDTNLIGPRLGSLKSEQNWTVLWAIARLFDFVDERNEQYHTSLADSIPNKRPRLSSRTDGVLQDAASGIGNVKASSLQLLVFLRRRISVESAKSLLDNLIGNIMDDNDFLASWAFLSIAR
jgi:serine-protein kinase ATM